MKPVSSKLLYEHICQLVMDISPTTFCIITVDHESWLSIGYGRGRDAGRHQAYKKHLQIFHPLSWVTGTCGASKDS